MTWSCRCCEPNPGGVLPVGTSVGDVLFWDGDEWIANNEGAPSAGDVLIWDGASWIPTDPSGPFVLDVTGGAGNIVSGGAGAAQAIALATIAAGDTVIVSRIVNGGAPGIAPLIVITAGVGFTLTFAGGDTSTYSWRVIR